MEMPDISHASAYKRSNRSRSDERSSLHRAVQTTSIQPATPSITSQHHKQGSRTRAAATSRHGSPSTSSSNSFLSSPTALSSSFSSSKIGEYSGAAEASSQATRFAPFQPLPIPSRKAASILSSPSTLSSSAPPSASRIPLRILVPVVACAAFVGIMGAILATCHMRRRRRQRTQIALPLSPTEKPRIFVEEDDDDEPAIWDNRPPAASPLPPHRIVLGQDSGEYSPTATLFSPMSLTFPPSAMEKHNEMAMVKSYDPRGWDSPPRSPPAIIVDRSSPTHARVSAYSSESFYSPSPSPIPSTDNGHSMRPFSPAMLDIFPAPPPLALSAHRSISIPCLRSPPAKATHSRMASDDSQLSPTSLHFASLRATNAHSSRVDMPTFTPTYHFPQRPPRRDHSGSPATSISSSSSSQSSSPRPRRKVVYGSPSRKQKSLQASRNSLELIRERGSA